jgi:hypothetical protein
LAAKHYRQLLVRGVNVTVSVSGSAPLTVMRVQSTARGNYGASRRPCPRPGGSRWRPASRCDAAIVSIRQCSSSATKTAVRPWATAPIVRSRRSGDCIAESDRLLMLMRRCSGECSDDTSRRARGLDEASRSRAAPHHRRAHGGLATRLRAGTARHRAVLIDERLLLLLLLLLERHAGNV